MRTIFPAMLLMFWMVGQSVLADDIPSNRTDKPITIDGKADDWPSLAGKFLKDENAAVTIANDDNYLYCTFRTNDMRWVRAIRIAGITLYVDINGGKHKDFYLKFTDGPSLDMLRPKGENQPDDEMQERSRAQQELSNDHRHGGPQLMLYIKDRLSEKEIPLDGSQGPAAAFDTSLGFYTYEFRIPLEYGEPLNFGLGAKPDKKIGIGLVWGDMSGLMKHERPEGRGPGGMGGDGGFPGGGMEPGGMPIGGRGGPPGGMRGNMPSKQEIWFKTKLSRVNN